MNNHMNDSILERTRQAFAQIAQKEDILSDEVVVTAKPLTVEEAIGTPVRRDYPIVTGKERVIEARYRGKIGHAFTDAPGDYSSTIGELLDLDLTDNARRAFFIASLNAAQRSRMNPPASLSSQANVVSSRSELVIPTWM